MNRKAFLTKSTLLFSGLGLSWKTGFAYKTPNTTGFRRPPYLKHGDLIGITCPAGAMQPEEMQGAIRILQGWGYNVKLGSTVGKKDFTFGGTDQERREDLQQMLNDHSIKAILCARGGYGSVRMVDGLKFDRFRKHPKWIIGFSDITVLLNHIHTNCHMATIHSKMCNSFPDDISILTDADQVYSIQSIDTALKGVKMSYKAVPNTRNRPGKATGILVGGNLKTIESLTGSRSDIHTDGKILFVEDTNEYLYSIDRMFWNLYRTGKLKNLKGLIIGGFKIRPDDPGEEFGKSLEDIVLEKVKQYAYPVCFDFPVGHQKANFALKCGIRHRLNVKDHEVTLVEAV